MQSEVEVQSGNRYLTVAQLAERLQVSASTIYGWVDRDVVPFLMAGDLLRFDPAAIDNWMATRAASTRMYSCASTGVRSQTSGGHEGLVSMAAR